MCSVGRDGMVLGTHECTNEHESWDEADDCKDTLGKDTLYSRNRDVRWAFLEVRIPTSRISTQNTIIISKQHSNIHSLPSRNASCGAVCGL